MTVRASAWSGLMASLAVVAAVVLDTDHCYSLRIALDGSTWTARMAGTAATAGATNAITPLAAAPVTGSRAWSSNTSAAISLAGANAPFKPTGTPPPRHFLPSHKTNPATVRRGEPMTVRPPMSLRRDATVCASAP
jgi:hypothetical protein